MAGEFLVMSQLFRLGHEPALTLGNAKSIDILVRSKSGHLYEISVKAVRGGGKWGATFHDESEKFNRIYVLLLFNDFENIKSLPLTYVIPAVDAEKMKADWRGDKGIYYSSRTNRPVNLNDYLNAWHHIA